MDALSEPEMKTALENARFAVLTSRACTDQAKSLVDALLAKVTSTTTNTRRTRGAYANTRKQRRRGLEAFLGDLLRAQSDDKAKGFVYRSLRPGSFTKQEIGYRAFIYIKDKLIEHGLVEIALGFQQWFEGFTPGVPLPTNYKKASRFRATAKLLEISAAHGVAVEDVSEHFVLDLPKDPLVLKGRSSKRDKWGQKTRGKALPIVPSALTDKLETQVRELNTFFDQFELRGGTHRGYLRVFNEGDARGFKWDKGGRPYSQGGEDSYQHLPKEDRLQMTINGESVCEIDIRASYLTILHAWYGEPLNLDPHPYTKPLGVEADEIVKWFCVATFGSDGHLTRWPSGFVSDYRKAKDRNLGKDYPLRKVRDAVLKAFPVLDRWGEDGKGWADLMYVESKAVVETMTDLMRDHSIPSLAVHDSILVPASKRAVAEEVLRARYRWATGVEPKLVVHEPGEPQLKQA